MKAWRVAVLGATGAVGRTMVRCLEESSITASEVRALASPRSSGQEVPYRGATLIVQAVEESSFDGIDLALFSAGAAASGAWAPVACRAGAWVVDNSSRWRMDPAVPLIVPEVNWHHLGLDAGSAAQTGEGPSRRATAKRRLIANPNCSTIQLVVALAPLQARFGLRRVVISTYQAASGKGQKGLQALIDERNKGCALTPVFSGRLLDNVLPQCDVFLEDGYTREEEKMIGETRKILGLPGLAVHPTCVRVPVDVAHSESVYVETERPASVALVREILAASPGIRLLDDPANESFPTPLAAAGTDPVWVGRVRQDRCDPCGLYLWIVADNLRKGAALNAVQIAQRLWDWGRTGP
jgi:aspartate-semialdehyde dehydrogenase